jgi:hypothetical protein
MVTAGFVRQKLQEDGKSVKQRSNFILTNQGHGLRNIHIHENAEQQEATKNKGGSKWQN